MSDNFMGPILRTRKLVGAHAVSRAHGWDRLSCLVCSESFLSCPAKSVPVALLPAAL